MKKPFLYGGSLLVLIFAGFYFFVYPKLMIVTGYAAKNMCSCVFVAGIDEKKVKAEDLNFDIIPLANIKVDYDNKEVYATVLGLSKKTAIYNENTGCALVNKISTDEVYRYGSAWTVQKYDSLENWFEYIDTVEYFTESQQLKMDKAINAVFIEEDSLNPKINTRAALVLYKGQLVGEQYAEGFDENSRLMGWSMTKSLTATMFAQLDADGKVDIKDKAGIPVWQEDARSEITWESLLHMNSGLLWEERYDNVSDAVLMLFNSDAVGEYAMSSPFESAPNMVWEYSSGTSNIIATQLNTYFHTQDEYVRYPYERLFHKIGMYTMLMETDAAGNFVGSSYSWASARDWAKIGQLYLQNGTWAGEQILTKEWIKFIQQPAPNANNVYGGHFWLNRDGAMPDVPTDTYSLAGFHNQKVYIIPSKELVVIRLGLTYNEPDLDFNAWLKQVIEALEPISPLEKDLVNQ